MTPARLRWGLLLVMVGLLALLAKAEVIDFSAWSFTVTFLPILLIAIGVEKIFTNSKYQAIAYAAPVILVLSAFVIAASDDNLSFGEGYLESKIIIEDFDSDIGFVEAVIDLGEGDLEIRDAVDELLLGRFREFSSKPEYRFERVADSARIFLTNTDSKLFGGIVKVETDEPDDWRLSFTRQAPLALTCSGRESDIHLNLATTPLERLRLDADRSDIYVKLGRLLPDVTVSVKGADSKLKLRVPRQAGLRIKGLDDPTFLYEIGLMRDNGSFITTGFDTLESRIDVDLDDRLQTLSIDYY